MARVRFTKGTRFLWHSQVYIVEDLLMEGRLLLRNTSFGGIERPTRDELQEAWGREEIVFEVFGKNTRPAPGQPIKTEYSVADFSSLPAYQQAVAWWRYEHIKPFLGLPPAQRSRAAIERYLKEHGAPVTQPPEDHGRESQPQPLLSTRRKRSTLRAAQSPASIERWLRDFIKSGYEIKSLVYERGGGKNKVRQHERVEEIIGAVISECKAKKGYPETTSGQYTAWDVYLKVVNRVAEKNAERAARGKQILEPPSYDTIRRRIKAAGWEAVLHRPPSNRLEAHAGSMVTPGPASWVTRIMQLLQIDDTWLDLFIVDTVHRRLLGRPNLTTGLDVYSGLPAGFYLGFEAPSAATALQCLLHCILPKPDCQKLYGTKNAWKVHGLPEMVAVDGGPGFRSGDFKSGCLEVGTVYEELPVQAAWYKASCERFFRTHTTGLLKVLPGSSFSNVLERGGYDPEKHACISLEGFFQMLHIFLVDYFPSKWHEGRECYPRKRWEESWANYEPAWPSSAAEARRILSRRLERTITAEGFSVETIKYNSPDLARMRALLPNDAKVQLRILDEDLGFVYALDETAPTGDTWLKVPASDQNYAEGLSWWAHKQIRAFVSAEKQAGERASIYELADAKQRIRDAVDREFLLTRKAHKRVKILRFLEGTGKGPQTQDVKAQTAAPASRPAEPTAALALAMPAPEGASPAPPAAIKGESEGLGNPQAQAARGGNSGLARGSGVSIPSNTRAQNPRERSRRAPDYGLPATRAVPKHDEE